jgi:hypothetical protein
MQSELDQLKVCIENNNSVAAELEFKIRKLEPPDLASLRSDFAKLDMKLEKVKHFLSKVSPLRTQIQISDVLQRVLTDQSVQAKLIELENDRVSFLTKRQISCEQWCEWA